MGNVFVGLLCAIGVFHLATEGYDLSDRVAGRLVCIFAFGVAWFPTTPEFVCSAAPTHAQNIIGDLHYTFAALLFFTLAFFCIFQFTQTADVRTRTRRKKERNGVYYSCGGAILGCVAVIGSVKAFERFKILVGFRDWLDSWKWNFWFESLALFAFGAAFLIKGEFILKDEAGSSPASNSSPNGQV
jgi:nitrate/nitrite transporter NarK